MGTYVVEFRTAEGEALAISIPRTEAAVIRHFQERRPMSEPRLPSTWSNTSMDARSLIVLVAALLLFLVIVVFIVAYLFQPIPVQ
jgi:hypothetical protein